MTARAARAVRTRTLTPRRMLDEGVEEVVAGECLATIKSLAPEADHVSSSHVRAAAKRPSTSTMRPPPLPVAACAAPAVAEVALTAPRVPLPPGLPSGPALVPAAFVRRSSPGSAVSSSVAPVTAEPTVIVVRGRPRAAWVFGAAALGAFVAIVAGRMLTSPEPAPPVVTAAAPPTPAEPPASTAIAAPPSGLAPAVALPPIPVAPPKPPSVVTFGDDQGVAITAAPRVATPPRPAVAVAPPRASAPAPAKGSSTLPDGTLTLGGTSAGPVTRPAPPTVVGATVAAPAAPPPEPTKKKALTPEQQLAEAQLKASMR